MPLRGRRCFHVDRTCSGRLTRPPSAGAGWVPLQRTAVAPTRSPHARLSPPDRRSPMKVTSIETLACDAGWRNYHFVKLTTDDGIVGWSEFDEGFGSPGVGAVIERLAPRVVGQPVGEHERIYAELYCATRPGCRRRRRAGASAPSRTRCSMPRPRRWACPATSCSAARSATASGSTGRTARPGASIIRAGTSRHHRPRRRQGDGPRGAREEVHRA